jgi:hypothetical protein
VHRHAHAQHEQQATGDQGWDVGTPKKQAGHVQVKHWFSPEFFLQVRNPPCRKFLLVVDLMMCMGSVVDKHEACDV